MNLNDMIAWFETRGFHVTVTQTKTGHMFKISKYDYHAVNIYEDGFSGEVAQQHFLDRLLSTWNGGYRLQQKLSKKKLVLVGKSNGRRAHTFMDLVTDLLSKGDEPVDVVRINWSKLIFETPHVEVRFFLKDSNPDWLMGLNADAIFGEEYPELLCRAKPGAIIASEYGGALTGYIRWIEREAMECKKIYISTASGNSEFYKRLMNSVYGAHPENRFFVDLNGSQPSKVEFLWGRQNGKTQACAEYMKTLIEKGEITMSEAEKIYIQQDVTGTARLAAVMREVDARLCGLRKLPGIKKVHFSGPVTAVIWEDKTKTIVRCKDGDEPDYEKGLAMAIAKKALGTNKSGSNYYDIFKQWLPKEEPKSDSEDRALIAIPKDGSYVEILGHRITRDFGSFEGFCNYLYELETIKLEYERRNSEPTEEGKQNA